MWILGRPLVTSVEEKAAAEGDFRYALTTSGRTRKRPRGAGDGERRNLRAICAASRANGPR